jgi:hypothetical protein
MPLVPDGDDDDEMKIKSKEVRTHTQSAVNRHVRFVNWLGWREF